MKDKILEALKTKYKNLGFGDKAFDGVASYLEKNIKEETEIETATQGVDTLLKAFQGEVDKVRGEKTTLQKELDELKKAQGNPTPEPTPNPNPQGGGNNQEDMPTWAKTILDDQKAIKDSLQAYSIEKITNSRKSTLESVLKDAPEAYRNSTLNSFGMMNFTDDESFNAYIEQTKTTANDLSLNASSSRPFGGGRSNSGKEASEKEIAAVVDKIQI